MKNLLGDFVIGECFFDIKCRHGHKTRLFNIGRGHYVACDKCKAYIFVGANLMDSWRHESKDVWDANLNNIEGYKIIE